MKKLKKILVKTCLILLILLPVTAFAHFLVFPHETKSILIDYSGFSKKGQIYFNPATTQNKVDSLQFLIGKASTRIRNFWGSNLSNPKYIYCAPASDFKKYSLNPSVPAVTYLKLGAYIVLSEEGVDLDIIAHEISHAELYERIGFYKFNYKIPSWFKHGLAMQNDERIYYSEDTLKARSDNFQKLPELQNLKSDAEFYAGTLEQIMFNYMTAKHEIKNWYSKEKLQKFIEDLNAGKSFKEAYGQ